MGITRLNCRNMRKAKKKREKKKRSFLVSDGFLRKMEKKERKKRTESLVVRVVRAINVV